MYADSDGAPKEMERKSSSCLVIKFGRLCSKRGQRRKTSSHSRDEAELYAAIPHKNRLPTSVACAWRFSRSSRDDVEARAGLGETPRYQSTLVSGSNRRGALPIDKVDSENSPADIGTKTRSADRTVHLLRLVGMNTASALLDNRSVELRRHKGSGDQGVIQSRNQCHRRMSAENLRKQVKWH